MSGSLSFVSAVVAGFGLLLSSPLGFTRLPPADMDELRSRAAPAYVARVRDAGGRTRGEIFNDGPLASPLALLPEDFLLAVIAIEDRRFFEHDGIDAIGLAGALASQFGANPRGGSTIDQQMAKNAWTGPEESLRRKIPEAVLALQARHLLGPEGVLQAYLETAWFGRGVTGVAGAAQAWFGRDWAELSLGEMAYLAGILKGPGFYDAERQPERAVQRRDQVLSAMLREGFIDEAAAEDARAEPLTPTPGRTVTSGVENRWFLTAARPEITRALGESPAWQSLFASVDVELTLSPDWQAIAQAALSSGVRSVSAVEPFAVLDEEGLAVLREARDDPLTLRRLARAHLDGVLPWDSDFRAGILLERDDESEEWTVLLSNGALRTATLRGPANLAPRPGQVLALRAEEEGFAASGRNTIEGAVVVLDPRDGSLIASVGGADPSLTAFDRTRARRQPGSAIKTFLWLAALEAGFHPNSPVPDYEQDYITENGEIWRPRNYGRSQSGMIPFASAYERSSNLAAAALIHAIGSDAMAQIAERAGAYPNGMPRHLSAALGTNEVTLIDLTRAHAAVVSEGGARRVTAIRDMNIDGRPLIADGARIGHGRFGTGPIASPFVIDDMLAMMRGVVRRGTGAQAFRDHPVTVAGKTGTSQGYRDAWFIAVTPHVAVGVWLGRDDDRPMGARMSGGRQAAPIAARILADAHRAGLIDAQGYRDGVRTSSIAWPPAQQFVQSAYQSDHFWGFMVEPAPAPAPTPRASRQVNRNTVMRHERWDGSPSLGGQVRPGAR